MSPMANGVETTQSRGGNSNGKSKSKVKPKVKKTSLIYYNKGYCVFCDNKNVDLLANDTKFFTAKDCGHQMCENCKPITEVDCPSCGTRIKKSGISEKTFEQLEYERERKIRVDVMKVFNLQEEDFDTLKEFHEYQELAETLIFNKMNKYDEAETDRIIVEHEQKNHDKINKNRQRLAIMNREIENDLKHQRLEELKLMTDIERQEMQKRAERELEIEETNRVRLGELTTTTAERKRLLELEKEKKKFENQLAQGYGHGGMRSTGYRGTSAQALAILKELQPKPMSEPGMESNSYSEEEKISRRKRAGGYSDNEAVRRTQYLMTASLFNV
mmetsp:Transcript_15113/g.17118  ORF Transcript_15113/g.17118 Transcript_15113/m.17118 type:complete len:330 (-) Transcript_15113:1144-2133(-)